MQARQWSTAQVNHSQLGHHGNPAKLIPNQQGQGVLSVGKN